MLGSNWDDPRTAAVFAAAQELLGRGGNMQRIAASGSAYTGMLERGKIAQTERERRAQEAALTQMRVEMIRKAQDAEAEQARRDEQFRSLIKSPLQEARDMALTGGGGPTVQNAANMPAVDPSKQLLHDAMRLGQIAPLEYIKATGPQQRRIVGTPKEGIWDLTDPSKPVQLVKPTDNGETADIKNFRYSSSNPQFDEWLERQANLRKPVTNNNVRILPEDKSYKEEGDLRGEFNKLPEVVRYQAALPAYEAVKGAISRDGTQSEINLIYGLAKLYDPDSVVREGEYATIANSQSIPEWLKGQAQRVAGGGRLTPETKRQIGVEADARIAALRAQVERSRAGYEGVAKRRGLDPQNVFINMPDVIDFNSLPGGK